MTNQPTYEATGKGAAKAPSHIAYQVRERDGKPSYWNRIGAVFAHGDGQGFHLQLESVPLDGRITLRVAAEK
jgi:hypothetical protein